MAHHESQHGEILHSGPGAAARHAQRHARRERAAEKAGMKPFAFAHGRDWRGAIKALGRPGRGLGFVYFTDPLVSQSNEILRTLREATGVADWIGTVGTG